MCGLGLMALSEPSAPVADGDHYREMAGRLRTFARITWSPGIRRELVDLAKRYDRRGDHFDCRSRAGMQPQYGEAIPCGGRLGSDSPAAPQAAA
jgi:hypothetical protein